MPAPNKVASSYHDVMSQAAKMIDTINEVYDKHLIPVIKKQAMMMAICKGMEENAAQVSAADRKGLDEEYAKLKSNLELTLNKSKQLTDQVESLEDKLNKLPKNSNDFILTQVALGKTKKEVADLRSKVEKAKEAQEGEKGVDSCYQGCIEKLKKLGASSAPAAMFAGSKPAVKEKPDQKKDKTPTCGGGGCSVM